MKNKVFCIGFHKTGTTTLAVALAQLGYRVTGPNGVGDPDIADNALPMACQLVSQFDAFQDNPWPIIYRELDQAFPGSKFILTLRDPDAWIGSQVRHFGTRTTPMRQWIYGVGSPAGHEEIYLERFKRHNREVLEFFQDRPEDLLIINVTDGDGWEKICSFLGEPIPDRSFPHANKAESREQRTSR